MRIEEIDSDEDEDEREYEDQGGLSFYPRRLGGMDVDGGRGWERWALENGQYADETESVDAVDYDLYDDGDRTVSYAVQLAMKDKEEWLVDKALERIRRAQMLGQENVRLSKRELEALERKRIQEDSIKEPWPRMGGPGTPERRKKRTENAQRRGSSVSIEATMPYSPVNEKFGSGGRATGATVKRQIQPTSRPTSSSDQRPRTPVTHSPRPHQSSPSFRSPFRQQYVADRYLNALESRPQSSSRNEAFQRPLPDDPRWTPPYRTMPPLGPYSAEQPPYQTFAPFDTRHGLRGHQGLGYPTGMSPYISNYRSFSDERHSSSTPNSLSPRVARSESATDESSEEDESSTDSDEEEEKEKLKEKKKEEVDVVQRKVPPKSKSRVAPKRGGRLRQRVKHG